MKKTLLWLVLIAVAIVLIVMWASRTQAPEAGLTSGNTVAEIEQDLGGLQVPDIENELQGLQKDLNQL